MKFFCINLSEGIIDFCLYKHGKALYFKDINSDLNNIYSLIKQHFINNNVNLNEIDFFAIGSGPGSYFGLKVSFAFIAGLALSRKKPIVSVSSLDLFAISQNRSGYIVPNVYKMQYLLYKVDKNLKISLYKNKKTEDISSDHIIKNEILWDKVHNYLLRCFYESFPAPYYLK